VKVLFFGIQYHNYTNAIINEMQRLGGEVTFVDLQPRSLLFKGIRTLAGPIYEAYVQRQLLLAVQNAQAAAFDKVVFLQAHQMPLAVLAALRETQPKAEFTLYNWDALTTHDYRQQAGLFHRVLTFDRLDAQEHRFDYLPLFCVRSWQNLEHRRADPKSVYMVGNLVRLERYRAIEKFRGFCIANGLSFREHLKISPVVFTQAVRQGVWPKNVSLAAISEHRFVEMLENSLAAFDFANHAQSGQTMRMMESLCTGKKIITNNKWVKLEAFYSPDRIHIIEGLDFSGIPAFLDTPIANPMEQFSEYHIQSFTRKLLGLEDVNGTRRHL
jgi:hypothetical protein